MKEFLRQCFQKVFTEADGLRFFFAPGRVNLIGEHIDYNGGCALPAALSLGTYAAVRRNGTKSIRMYSMSYPEAGKIEVDMTTLAYQGEQSWANYPLGVVWAFQAQGMYPEEGFDVIFKGTLPTSAGLSSSASIEVLTATFLCALYGYEMSTTELALIAKKAENEFIGVQCGILDQLSVAAGKKDHAFLLNTNTLAVEYAPFVLPATELLIINSNRSRKLTESKYNERRSECEQALACMSSVCKKFALCDYTGEEFEQYQGVLTDPVLLRRTRHVIYENLRTKLAYQALKSSDMAQFGALLTASHLSLKEDYETSCKETDFLALESIKQKGVLGARMTGAGFGGCVIVLLEKAYAAEYKAFIEKAYYEETGLVADVYNTTAGDGPIEIM